MRPARCPPSLPAYVTHGTHCGAHITDEVSKEEEKGMREVSDDELLELGMHDLVAQRREILAKKHGKTPAQILLRWALDQNVSVIPGATSAAHIRDNLHLKAFHLTEADRKLIADKEPAHFRRLHNLGRTPTASKRADVMHGGGAQRAHGMSG